MAKQGISTGSSPNDGLGDSLLSGAIKINSNFTEIYNTFGNGTNLVSYANTSGISSISLGLTGTPSITVNKIVAGVTSSIIPFLWGSYGDLPSYSSYHGAVAHAHDTGKLYYAHTRWVEVVNTEIDGTVGTGTENYKVGVLTATSLSGNGGGLTGVGISFQNQSTPVGIGITLNFIGTGVTVTNTAGVATVSITAGVGGTGGSSTLSGLTDVSLGAYVGLSSGQLLRYDGPTGKWINASVAGLTTESDPVFTASVAFGITATNITNWNNAYGWGDHNIVGYATQGYVTSQVATVVSGASTFSYIKNTGITSTKDLIVYGTGNDSGSISTMAMMSRINYLDFGPAIPNTSASQSFALRLGSDRATGTFGLYKILEAVYYGGNSGSVFLNNWNGNEAIVVNDTGVIAGRFVPVLVGGISSTGTSGQKLQVTGDAYVSGNTGIGTTISTSKLHVIGDVKVVGTVTATAFVGDGSGLTGVIAGGSGIIVRDDGSLVGTASSIDFGANLSVSVISAGVVTVTGSAGGSSQWVTTSAGIHTLSNVGVGTTNPTSKVDVLGDVKITGVSTFTGGVRSGDDIVLGTTSNSNKALILGGTSQTAQLYYNSASTRNEFGGTNIDFYIRAKDYTFATGASGFPAETAITITQDGSVALYYDNSKKFETIGTGATVTGTTFTNQLNVSGVSTFNNSLKIANSTFTGTYDPNTISFRTGEVVIDSVSHTLRLQPSTTDNNGSILFFSRLGVTGGSLQFRNSATLDFNLTGDISVSGIATAKSFRTNSTVGDGTDVGFAIKYYITSNGSSGYRFAGPGIVNTIDNPTLYLHRGFTYIFENSTGGSHPFAIRYSSGGTGYGSTYLSGSQSGTQVFTIPFDAPSSLVYQCTIHSGMVGTFNIVS